MCIGSSQGKSLSSIVKTKERKVRVIETSYRLSTSIKVLVFISIFRPTAYIKLGEDCQIYLLNIKKRKNYSF